MRAEEKVPGADNERKRGNRLGFWFFRAALRLFGHRGAYGLLYIVCLHYLLFDQKAVRNTLPYVHRRFGERGFFRDRLEVYRIFFSQGQNLIDRFCLMTGVSAFDIALSGHDKISRFTATGPEPQGIVLLTAHVGNWQVTMSALEKFGRVVNLLMRPEDNAAVKDALSVTIAQGRLKVITTDEPMGGVLSCLAALKRGEIVSIMSDRSYGAETVGVPLLGKKARLPFGAFPIAVAAGCPVALILSAKTGPDSYEVEVARVIEPAYADRRQKGLDHERWMAEVAGALEDYAMRHPYQWFVFADIWEQ